MNVRVRIELQDIICRDTEDITGADTFYLVGALSDGASTKAVLTRPVWINNYQTKPFRPEDQLLFDARVPERDTVRGGLTAFDQDYAKDWAKHGDMGTKITNGVAALLAASGNPKAIAAGAILKGAVTVWDGLARLDVDDKLGSLELTVPASGPSAESKSWDLKKTGWGLSTWDYTIRYRITRTFPQLLLRVTPSIIPEGRPAQVTVSAEGAETHARAVGVVKIDNVTAGNTNTPFTYTFNSRRRIRPFPGLVYPQGVVIVPNYEDARIDFGFPEEENL